MSKEIKEIELDRAEQTLQNFVRVGAPGERVKPQNFAKPVEQVFKIWSQYPFITRDIAVWVPEGTEPETLAEIYKEFGTELMQGEPKLVDTFTKNGKTSYAFRLIFQSFDRTLTDEEINAIMSKITEKIANMGFEVR